MSEVNKEFLKKLTDQELVDEYHDRWNWNDLKDKSESIIWKICDRYEEETGFDVDVQQMEMALTDEILKRFALMVSRGI